MLRNLHLITMRGNLVQLLGSGRMTLAAEEQESAAEGTIDGDGHVGGDGSSGRRTAAALDTSSSSSAPHSSAKARLTPSSQRASPADAGGHHPRGLVAQDALTLMAMYLSAIIHDYDHRGVTNAFLIQDEDPLAVRGEGEGRERSTETGCYAVPGGQ